MELIKAGSGDCSASTEEVGSGASAEEEVAGEEWRSCVSSRGQGGGVYIADRRERISSSMVMHWPVS